MKRLAPIGFAAALFCCCTLPVVAQLPPKPQISEYDEDVGNLPYPGEIAMTPDTTYAVGRSLKAACTTPGNVSVTYADGSTGIWGVVIGTQTLPIVVNRVNSSGTTATCAYGNLK